jgi:phosphorylase kinase alpha/beta subunit
VSLAWQAFYQLPPQKVADDILNDLIPLLDNNNKPHNKETAYDPGR